jgi:hypothetical protein
MLAMDLKEIPLLLFSISYTTTSVSCTFQFITACLSLFNLPATFNQVSGNVPLIVFTKNPLKPVTSKLTSQRFWVAFQIISASAGSIKIGVPV